MGRAFTQPRNDERLWDCLDTTKYEAQNRIVDLTVSRSGTAREKA
jgi:hypothetical protein